MKTDSKVKKEKVDFPQFMEDIRTKMVESDDQLLGFFNLKDEVNEVRSIAKKLIKEKIIIVPEIVNIPTSWIGRKCPIPLSDEQEKFLIIPALVGLAACGSIINTSDNITKTLYKIQRRIGFNPEEEKVCKGLYLESYKKYPNGIFLRTEDFGEKQRPFTSKLKKKKEKVDSQIMN